MKVDPLSEEFIAWSKEKLSNPDFYKHFMEELPRKAANYYSYPKLHLMEKLEKKLRKGAKEHGPPIHALEWLEDELRQEYIDMIGYTLLIEWNKKRLED
jgi:hypothetical protein